MRYFILWLWIIFSTQAEIIWFDDLIHNSVLSQEIEQEVIRFIAARVFDESAIFPDWNDTAPRILFLSVSDGENPARVYRGEGIGIEKAVEDALVSMPADVRWLKVDFVGTTVASPDVDLTDPLATDASLAGLAFDKTTGVAFLPEELVAYALIDGEGYIRPGQIQNYLEQHERVLPLSAETTTSDLFQFTTHSYFTDGTSVIPLFRGHRLYPQLDPQMLLNAAVQGGEYLKRMTNSDGSFIYEYHAEHDVSADEYNILRHAGTTYSMLELYAVTEDVELLASAESAVGYLQAQVKPCTAPVSRGSALCVVEDDEVKLGGNGLAIIALAEHTRVTDDKQHLPLMQQLADWMTGAQNEDGSYKHKIIFSTGEITDFESEYYPGEAILALTRLYQLDGDERWLDSAEAAAIYLITIRDAGRATVELPHDHWLLYGLNELYRLRPNPLYLSHSRRIVDAIITSQHRNNVDLDWIGGFYSPPRSTPAATRTEGLCAAYQLQQEFNGATEGIVETAELALRFQLQTQLTPESVMYLPEPQRALGGFRRSLTEFEVRIDYVQHNISSLLCWSALLNEAE